MSYTEFNYSYTYARTFFVHSRPYLEHLFISHSSWIHANCCMYGVVECLYKLWQYVDESKCSYRYNIYIIYF